jgi:site-specific DNA-methyltransferase (adenine-specific)
MQALRQMSDNQYDLAIVDPPYFEEFAQANYTGPLYSTTGVKRSHKRINNWSIPNAEYFAELKRVSKHQIIWGVNYYAQHVSTVGRVIWDKINDTSTFSKCEIASHSVGVRVDQFRYRWNGMIQGDMKNKEHRIHPCQKPVVLYEWLLDNYADPGDRILDTHLGSGSIAVACHNTGHSLDAYEIDAEYFAAAQARLNEHQRQMRLF